MYQPSQDLAGEVCFRPNFFQTKARINYLIDQYLSLEVNHMTKFLGMGMWLYPEVTEQVIRYILSQINTILPLSYEVSPKPESDLKSTFQRMMLVLNWQSWSLLSKGELIYTFMWILKRMWLCCSQLTPEYIQSCCASPEFFGNNNLKSSQPEISIF